SLAAGAAQADDSSSASKAPGTERIAAMERMARSLAVARRPLRAGGAAAPGSDLFFDPRRLARQLAQVIELRAAYVAAALHLDAAGRGAVGLEHALAALAMADLAHGERGVQATVALGDHDPLVGLHALAVAFLDLDLHDD